MSELTQQNLIGCPHCTAQVGSRGGLSTHIRIKHPEHHRPRPKYQSRSTRLSTACGTFAIASSALEAARDNLESWISALESAEEDFDADETHGDDEEFDGDKYIAENPIPGVTISADDMDQSEIEFLKDEMESWRDNMEDKLSHTTKYEEVSEAADALDDLVSSAEEARDAVEEADGDLSDADAVRECIDKLNDAIEACETVVNGESNVSFPGMYS